MPKEETENGGRIQKGYKSQVGDLNSTNPSSLAGLEESSADYEQLLLRYGGLAGLEEGEVVRGRVLKITASEVVVDVGFKSEGVIPSEEFIGPDGRLSVKVGDEVDVLLEHAEDQDGHVVLSRQKVENRKVWEEIERAFDSQSILEGVVVSRIKGGLTVDIGVRAFLPGSQIDIKPVKDLDNLVGRTLECRVIKINRKRNNIVISRKAILEERLSLKKEHTLARLYDGAVVQGTVKNITDYGVFVDLGGVDGLLHVTDISWGRVHHPSSSFVIGAEVQVKVLKLDKKKERVSLGIKQLAGDPWGTALDKYPVGSRVQGRVVSLADYGAFVELEEGIEGLVHISEMTWSRRLKSVSKVLSTGDVVEVVVLEIIPAERRLSLGMKQVEDDPWKTLPERYSVGQVIHGVVRNLADFGAFVEVEEGIDGLVHISDLSATRKIKHPSEVLRKGEQVDAVVLSIDAENHRISLGLRQLQSYAKMPEAVLNADASQLEASGPSARAARAAVQSNFQPRETPRVRQIVSEKGKLS